MQLLCCHNSVFHFDSGGNICLSKGNNDTLHLRSETVLNITEKQTLTQRNSWKWQSLEVEWGKGNSAHEQETWRIPHTREWLGNQEAGWWGDDQSWSPQGHTRTMTWNAPGASPQPSICLNFLPQESILPWGSVGASQRVKTGAENVFIFAFSIQKTS